MTVLVALEAWDPALHPRGPDGRFVRKGVVAALLGGRAVPRGVGAAGAARGAAPRRRLPLAQLGAELDRLVDLVDVDAAGRERLRERLAAVVAAEVDLPRASPRSAGAPAVGLGQQILDAAAAARADPGPAHRAGRARGLVGDDWIFLSDLRPHLSGVPREELDAELRRLGRGTDPAILVAPVHAARWLTDADRDAALVMGGEPNQYIRILRPEVLRSLGTGTARGSAAAARAGVSLPPGLVGQLRAAGSRERVRELLGGLTVGQLRAVASELGVAVGRAAKPRLVEQLVASIIGRRLDFAAISTPREVDWRREAWDPALHPRGPDGQFVDRGVVAALLGGVAAAGRSVAGSARRAARAAAARLRAAVDTDQARELLADLSLLGLRTLADELAVPLVAQASRSEVVEQLVRAMFARREAFEVAAAEAATAAGQRLKRYWTTDPEGLAKWATRPHPWTALYRQLVRHMPAARAKRVASAWFREVFGIWPGERFGANPVGPG